MHCAFTNRGSSCGKKNAYDITEKKKEMYLVLSINQFYPLFSILKQCELIIKLLFNYAPIFIFYESIICKFQQFQSTRHEIFPGIPDFQRSSISIVMYRYQSQLSVEL